MRQLRNYRAAEAKGEAAIENDIHAAAQKYDGMSAEQLDFELMRAVADAKRDGTFSTEMLDSFVEFVSPSLDDSSRNRLYELVAAIKSE